MKIKQSVKLGKLEYIKISENKCARMDGGSCESHCNWNDKEIHIKCEKLS